MKQLEPTILVIVGISGDLSARKLLPALAKIGAAGQLPAKFRLVGVSRKALDKTALIEAAMLDTPAAAQFLENTLDVVQLNYDAPAGYDALAAHLSKIEQSFGAPAQRLFYLSVPPNVAMPIVDHLGRLGVAALPGTKLLLEKPFGVDLASAKEFIAHTLTHFKEEQIYRIDHYLAKEMAQNLIVFRGGNTLFRRTWSHEFIERIDILASEQIDIEGRAGFYEQAGALRDLVQSHLLQLAALTLMDLPPLSNLGAMRQLRLEALKNLQAASTTTVAGTAVRGQYQGYRDEVKNPESTTETFVHLELASADPKWKDVPISITTGKALAAKTTEIHIYYRKEYERESNVLTLKIAPKEGMVLNVWVKKPGYDLEFANEPLDYVYEQYYHHLPEAYEQVLLEAMRGDQTLFASSQEVLASWEILAPVQAAWAAATTPPRPYAKGATVDDVLTAGSA